MGISNNVENQMFDLWRIQKALENGTVLLAINKLLFTVYKAIVKGDLWESAGARCCNRLWKPHFTQ